MSNPIVVVGAGLAGLACAGELTRNGKDVVVLEASDAAGGKLRTDEWQGFRLDRGFQVYFDAYPNAQKVLNHDALDLRKFEAGTLVKSGHRLEEVHREKQVAMAFSTYLTLLDKLSTLRWNDFVSDLSEQAIWALRDCSGEDQLRAAGFSDAFLERFARPFFGGIFLDRSLQTSRQMFAFVWKMLLQGDTVIPALGMQEIGRQLATMPVRTGAKVARILDSSGKASGVELTTGERIEAEAVVIAVDYPEAERLTGQQFGLTRLGSTCVYFRAPEPPVERPILTVRGPEVGEVNHVVPISVVAPETAPKGEHLVSASILGIAPGTDRDIASRVRTEIESWFPDRSVGRWQPLAVYRIAQAQFFQPAGFRATLPKNTTKLDGLLLAGEFTEYSSIDGAILSGLKAAALLA